MPDTNYLNQSNTDKDREAHDRAVYEATHTREESNQKDLDKRYSDYKEGYQSK